MAYRFRLLLALMIAVGVAFAISLSPLPDSAQDDDIDRPLLADVHSSHAIRIDFHVRITSKPARTILARARRPRVDFTSEARALPNLLVLSRLWHRGPPSSSLV